jgi:hypothetical protein
MTHVCSARSTAHRSRLHGGTGLLVLLLTGPGQHSAKEKESALGVAVGAHGQAGVSLTAEAGARL